MKSSIRMILLILSVITLFKEAMIGIPIFGGSYVLSLGWAPLGTNIMLYLIIAAILMADRYNEAKPLLYIPILGILFNIFAFIPVVGMMLHWVMTLMMIYFIIRIMSYRRHVGNVQYYDGVRRETVNSRTER